MESQQIALSLRFFDDSSEEQAGQDNQNNMFFQPPSASGLDQISIISDYLAFQYLKPFSQQQSQEIQSDPHEHLVESTENSKEAQNGAQTNRSKNKSMFHNLQKHLITFLKRMVYLKRVDLMSQPAGLKAYQLWKIFKTCKDCSKKSLYIIVGSSQLRKKENMKKIANSLPQLQKILKKTDFGEIQQAQDLLRDSIHRFIASIPKNVIRERCKMGKFDEFYSYLLNFMDELKGEGVSMRMKKQQKEKMLHHKIAQPLPAAPPRK